MPNDHGCSGSARSELFSREGAKGAKKVVVQRDRSLPLTHRKCYGNSVSRAQFPKQC